MSTSLRLLAEPELIWLAAIVIAALASVGAMRLRLRQSMTAPEDVVGRVFRLRQVGSRWRPDDRLVRPAFA